MKIPKGVSLLLHNDRSLMVRMIVICVLLVFVYRETGWATTLCIFLSYFANEYYGGITVALLDKLNTHKKEDSIQIHEEFHMKVNPADKDAHL